MTHALGNLTSLEARVVGVLMEKQATTPDVYPLTLNALTAGCNQRSSRNPVMSATEAEVQSALEGLRRHSLIIESYGASGRVMRYAHNLPKVLNVGQATAALLAVMILRGPQTAAELRANAERFYAFADASSVEAFLEEMAARSAGALAVKLARQPGSRESRWAHLLCGPVDDAMPAAPRAAPRDETGDLHALRGEVAALRDEVGALRTLVEQLQKDIREPGGGA
jgi:uncharacterized protein